MGRVSTPAAAKVPDVTWRRLAQFATRVVGADTMVEQLEASQDLLEQAMLVRKRLVRDAANSGMTFAEIGRTLNMSPEGARKLRLAAEEELGS